MRAVHSSLVRNFFATAVFLGASLGCATPVFATWWAVLNPDTTLTYLDSRGGPVISVRRINDAGRGWGWLDTAGGAPHAFITGPGRNGHEKLRHDGCGLRHQRCGAGGGERLGLVSLSQARTESA
jgi:hypothetical protein